jgi:hypothetical protein
VSTNQTNVDRARQLVASSQILNQAEKNEWSQLIPLMNDQQVSELVKILTPPVKAAPVAPVVLQRPVVFQSAAVQPAVPKPTPPPVPSPAPAFKLGVNLSEKELPPGLPVRELDLPAPKPAPEKPPQPAPVPAPAVSSLEAIMKNVVAAQQQVPSPVQAQPVVVYVNLPPKPVQTRDEDLGSTASSQQVTAPQQVPRPVPAQQPVQPPRLVPLPVAKPAPPAPPQQKSKFMQRFSLKDASAPHGSPSAEPTAQEAAEADQPEDPTPGGVSPGIVRKPLLFGPQPGDVVLGKMALPVLREYDPELVKKNLLVPLQHAADFAKLSTSDLHYSHPDRVLASLLQHIVELSRTEPVWSVVENLEQSPLYRAYVDTGKVLLDDWNADASRYDMSREEFEAFVDFRKKLDAVGM